jgi:hypothetical protein
MFPHQPFFDRPRVCVGHGQNAIDCSVGHKTRTWRLPLFVFIGVWRLLAHPVTQTHTQAQPTDDYQAKDEGSKPHLLHIISFTPRADGLLPWWVCYPDVPHTKSGTCFQLRPHTDRMETLGTAFQSYWQHKYVKLLFIFVSSVQTLISNLWGTGHTKSMLVCCQ